MTLSVIAMFLVVTDSEGYRMHVDAMKRKRRRSRRRKGDGRR
jgi:hypothetical protein